MGKAIDVRRSALNPQEIHAQLRSLQRGPFTQVLADFMGCQPTLEAMKQFADKSPDRWAQAVAIFAKLGGFHEKLEIEGNIAIEVGKMSDAELEQAIIELMPGEYHVRALPPSLEGKEKGAASAAPVSLESEED